MSGASKTRPALVLLTCMLASSLSFVDGSVVNVALPFIAKALGRSAAAEAWVIDAYLLPLSALLLLGGAAGDRFGRRRLLMLGIAVFLLGSVLCGFAPNYAALLAFRALQGVGAAILLPNSLSVLSAEFEGAARGRAVGAWSAMGAGAAAIGPVLGGWLADSFGWRAIFFINAPLALAALALAWAVVRDPRPEHARGGHFDLAGGVLATLGLGGVAAALTLAGTPGGATWRAAALGVGGLVALAAFAWVERRRGPAAMAPPDLLASPLLAGLNAMTFLVYGALGGLLVLLPYALEHEFGFNGLQAGAALAPFPLLMVCVSPLSGGLVAKAGPRIPLTVGALLLAAGFLMLLRLQGQQAHYLGVVLPAVLLMALGMSATAAPLTTSVLGSAPPGRTGVASGLNSAVARTGGLIATALLGGALAAPRGPALVGALHLAAMVGAAACLTAAVCGVVLLGRRLPHGAAAAS